MNKVGKRAFLLLLAIPIVINVMAQETKKPTLEDLIPGGESYRYAENLYGLQWWGDECIKPGIDTIYSIQPQTGKERMLITREQINKALAEDKAGKLSHLYSVRFPWAEKPQMLLNIAGKYIVYDFKNNRIVSSRKPKAKAENRRLLHRQWKCSLYNRQQSIRKRTGGDERARRHRLRPVRTPQ